MTAVATPTAVPAADAAIHPFRYTASEAELADLRRRIESVRWPEPEPVNDFSQGVPSATIRKLADYWLNQYDWRRCEARLNALPQFLTQIDGLDIHFIHVRSKHEDALPLVVTHGWPGSIVEQLKIIGPLTDPTAHGGKAEDAFHLVIPSMPGYGFSGKPTTPGWGPDRIAAAWITLMKRLGYHRFGAQGGDWGAIVTDLMAIQGAPELVGIHTNMAGVVPPEIDTQLWAGKVPANLAADETVACKMLVSFYKQVYYAFLMGTRPQTLTGLADSPIALATWMIDHDARSLELIARSLDGIPEGLTRDDVLDNITLFWLTNTGVSAARLYWENKRNFFAPKGVAIPVGVSVFPDELFQAPRSWVEQAYPGLVYYNRHPKGGHFAAWEQPAALCHDVRETFRSLR
ncbi:MAG TPA: epoxide hydrolase [Gemmatimonadales bacterium]|nr:epoxide hydrolase [Gemmatimonadales bacterium]